MELKVQDVLDDLKAMASEEKGYGFGELWRYDQDSITAVLPILRSNGHARSYITAAEAGSDLVISDTGNISLVRFQNKGQADVLLRTGEIVEGGTQERTLTKSLLIGAGQQADVAVHCVYASNPITPGASMKVADVRSPSFLRSSFYRTRPGSAGYQGHTWSGIRSYTQSLQSDMSSGMFVGAPATPDYLAVGDDLATAQKRVQETFRDVTKSVPHQIDQVGFVLITIDGPQGMESFNHAQSYEAVREALLAQDASTIGQARKDADSVFEFRPERAEQQARQLLAGPYEVEADQAQGEGVSFKLTGTRLAGEAVYHRGELVYLALTK